MAALQNGRPEPTSRIKPLKYHSTPDWGLHAAAMLQRQLKNPAMVAPAALHSGFKRSSLL